MPGEKPGGDPRVQRALDSKGLKYVTTDAGDFKLLFTLDNSRSQLVFVTSQTEEFAGLEIRDVWSIASIGDGVLDLELMRYVLKRNGEVKFGAWRVIESDEGEPILAFAAHTPADADGDTLSSVLQFVTNQADQLEGKVTKDDVF
jgi:hypothetical protein